MLCVWGSVSEDGPAASEGTSSARDQAGQPPMALPCGCLGLLGTQSSWYVPDGRLLLTCRDGTRRAGPASCLGSTCGLSLRVISTQRGTVSRQERLLRDQPPTAARPSLPDTAVLRFGACQDQQNWTSQSLPGFLGPQTWVPRCVYGLCYYWLRKSQKQHPAPSSAKQSHNKFWGPPHPLIGLVLHIHSTDCPFAPVC